MPPVRVPGRGRWAAQTSRRLARPIAAPSRGRGPEPHRRCWSGGQRPGPGRDGVGRLGSDSRTAAPADPRTPLSSDHSAGPLSGPGIRAATGLQVGRRALRPTPFAGGVVGSRPASRAIRIPHPFAGGTEAPLQAARIPLRAAARAALGWRYRDSDPEKTRMARRCGRPLATSGRHVSVSEAARIRGGIGGRERRPASAAVRGAARIGCASRSAAAVSALREADPPLPS